MYIHAHVYYQTVIQCFLADMTYMNTFSLHSACFSPVVLWCDFGMECNKEESFRCLSIAEEYLARGDKEKAVKFIVKSQKLYLLEEANGIVSVAPVWTDYCSCIGQLNFNFSLHRL